jgi:hypothetical protein
VPVADDPLTGACPPESLSARFPRATRVTLCERVPEGMALLNDGEWRGVTRATDAPASALLLRALAAAAPRLEALSLTSWARNRKSKGGGDEAALQALAPLAASLTSLEWRRFGSSWLASRPRGAPAGLAALPRLQRLRLQVESFDKGVAEAVAAALPRLEALTHLCVRVDASYMDPDGWPALW